jgi:hypothetical protein
MFTVNEFEKGRWLGQWVCNSEEEARKIIGALIIGRKTKTYNIEHQDGYVIAVWKPK